MKVSDHQIPEGMNCADYCDALRAEGYKQPAPAVKRAQKPQVPALVQQKEKTPVDEHLRAGS